MNTNNTIKLSILSDKRKIIKSGTDKVYRILNNEHVKNSCICEVWLRLNVLNEGIKDGKNIYKDDLIDDLIEITNRLEKLIHDFSSNKKKIKTLSAIYNDINDILYIDIMGFKKVESNFNNDDLPF